MEKFENTIDLISECEKNLEILNMLINKTDSDLDDVIRELYFSSSIKYTKLKLSVYSLKNIFNKYDINELFGDYKEDIFYVQDFKDLLNDFGYYRDYKGCLKSL